MASRKNRARGISLIELLISITLNVVILGVLLGIFLSTQKNHRALAALTEIQENTHIASQLLSSAIRTAGYSGCGQYFSLTRIDAKNDSFTIHRTSPLSATVVKSMIDPTILSIGSAPVFSENKTVLISNCKTADIATIKRVTQKNKVQEIELAKPLAVLYEKFSEFSELETKTFHVEKTGRFDEKNRPISALYSNNTELVDGVEKINLRYGVIVNHVLVEKSADELDANEKIVGVSIELTLSSLNLFPLEKKAYVYVALREP